MKKEEMDHVLNESTLFDCSSYLDCPNQITPFKCKTCPDFETNFLVSLKHHNLNHNISGHRKKNSKYTVYQCLRCVFVTYSRFLHLRHTLLSECTTADEAKKERFIACYADDADGGTKFGLINKSIDPPEENCKNIELCKPGSSINSRTNSTGNKLIKSSPSKSGWWYCGQCPYKCEYRSYLMRHITYRHTELKDIQWFKCDQCASKFKHKKSLNKHVKFTHSKSEDSWVKCDQCSYKTKERYGLKRHITHRHSKPEDIHWFKCAQCPYKSIQKTDLTRHVTRRHPRVEGIQGSY